MSNVQRSQKRESGLHVILPSNMEGITVPLEFLFNSASNSFYVHCLAFQLELISNTCLCCCIVEGIARPICNDCAEIMWRYNISPSICDFQNGHHCNSITEWSKRHLTPLPCNSQTLICWMKMNCNYQ